MHLDVLVDGKRVLQVVANRRRGDLAKAGLGSGRHGFDARLPGELQGRLEVRRSKDRALLALTDMARRDAAALFSRGNPHGFAGGSRCVELN